MEIKERVITEATRMFSEMGIKSVRMDDIAVACGISKRTLYENFADRKTSSGSRYTTISGGTRRRCSDR